MIVLNPGLIVISNLEFELNAVAYLKEVRGLFPDARIVIFSSGRGEESASRRKKIESLRVEWADVPDSGDFSSYYEGGPEWLLHLEGGERLIGGFRWEALSPGYHDATIVATGDRIFAKWQEPRVWINPKRAGGESKVEDNDASLPVLRRSLFVPPEQTDLRYAPLSVFPSENPGIPAVKKAIHTFGCYRYQCAKELFDRISKIEWPFAPIFSLLCSYSLGKPDEALDALYNLLLEEEESAAAREAAYLFAKAAARIEEPTLKKQALGFIEAWIDQVKPSVCLATDDADWLYVKGELLDSAGQREEALLSWRQALEVSNYTYTKAGYRISEAAQGSGLSSEEKAQLVMQAVDLDHPNAKSLLYATTHYMQLDAWKTLFSRHHESTYFKLEPGEDAGLITVVLPVYNDTAYLDDAIRSVLNQSYSHFELLVIDDGSDPALEPILKRYWYDRRIRSIRLESNGGLPSALNRGLQAGAGTYFTWTSADNQAHPRWLEHLIAALSASEERVGAISDYYHIDEDGVVLESVCLKGYELNGFQNAGPSFLWRKSAVDRVGGYDDRLRGMEDRDFTTRMGLAGLIHHVPEKLYYYRLHDDSLSARIGQGLFGGWEELHRLYKERWIFLQFC